jgi:hypothetical protein
MLTSFKGENAFTLPSLANNRLPDQLLFIDYPYTLYTSKEDWEEMLQCI